MTNPGELKQTLAELLATQPLAVLATHGHAGSHASLVAFAATNDLRHLVFATCRTTRKFANLAADPRVALLVDNRSNRESDFQHAVAATVRGEAREAPPARREQLLATYLARHPHLREFASSPACALLDVTVHTCSVVTRFQQVVELHISR